MNELNVIDSRELFGKQFRVFGTAEEPLFLAKDVAEWIEHSNPTEMVRMIEDSEKLNSTIFSAGQNREVTFLTEDGLYEVLMQSRKPIAKEFKKAVKDILKSIRKHGAYMTAEVIERTLTDPDYLIQLATKLKAEKEARLIAEHKVKEMSGKAAFYDTVTGSKDCVDMALAAKVLNFSKGRNTLFSILREHKILDRRNLPYQEFCDRGYFRVIESAYTKPTGEACTYFKTVIFQRGLEFLRRFLVKNGYMRDAS